MKQENLEVGATDSSDSQPNLSPGAGRFYCPKCGTVQSFWRIECSPVAVYCRSCNLKVRIRLPTFRSFTWVLIAVVFVILLISTYYLPNHRPALYVAHLLAMFVIDLLVSYRWGRVERDG